MFNNKNIYSYDLEEYKKLSSVIYRNFKIYFTPVKTFISFGNMEKENEIDKIKFAAKKALAAEFIERSNMKYESCLTKAFKKWIRTFRRTMAKLALARVFFSNAPVLIFDEPTSSLDPVSEK